MNYFDFYNEILFIFEKDNPRDFHELIKLLNTKPVILDNIDLGTDFLVNATLEITDNLIDDNFIKGTKTVTKSGDIYSFNGLTTQARIYLQSLKKEPKSIKSKLMKYLKDNGLPLDATSISKAVINLLW